MDGLAATRDHPCHSRHWFVHGRRRKTSRFAVGNQPSDSPARRRARRVGLPPHRTTHPDHAGGEALLQLSHRVFQDLQETVTAISEKQESLRGALRLVGGMTVCLYVFPTLLSEVRGVHPNLDLKVTAGGKEPSNAMLRICSRMV